MSARCRALHLQTVIDFNFWVLRSSSEVQEGGGGWKQPDDPKCEVLPAASLSLRLALYISL